MAAKAEDGMEERLERVERVLGHRFADTGLLLQGCTHAGALDNTLSEEERRRRSNERLEFLGDAVLGAGVATRLMQLHPDADEGRLSKAKSQLVSRSVLAERIETCGLLPVCRTNGPMHDLPVSVKANLAEGILGAIFLDGGWPALLTAIDRFYRVLSIDAVGRLGTDAKTRLQEFCLKRFGELPRYESRRKGGTDHEPVFSCRVAIAEEEASAKGRSRQASEAAAADRLLARLERAGAEG